MTTASRIPLAIRPRDGFVFRDGHGWHTTASGRARTLPWPFPSTVLGALRTAWGRRWEQQGAGRLESGEAWRRLTAVLTLGPMLPLRRPLGEPWAAAHRLWPVPRDALYRDHAGQPELLRLEPQPLPACTLGTDDALEPALQALWWALPPEQGGQLQKPLPPPPWWTDGAMVSWLMGEAVQLEQPFGTSAHLGAPTRLQVHVGIDRARLTAAEHRLYAYEVVETLEIERPAHCAIEWAIGCELALRGAVADPVDLHHAPVTLGGDRRPAVAERLPPAVFEMPEALVRRLEERPPRGLRLIAVSPLCFERGWLPDGLVLDGKELRGALAPLDLEVVLRAALVGRPLHVSGWDMHLCRPKPTSRLVPPGSVYYLQRPGGEPFGPEEFRTLWLAGLGTRVDEGYGRVVPGVWEPPAAL